MTTGPIFRTTTLLSLMTVLIAGCATRNPETEASNPFMHHWQEQAIGREGFSPSVQDLQPEPRVLMQEKAKPLASTVKKALPDAPVTLKVQDSPVPVVLRMLAKSANVSLMISPAVTGLVSLDVTNELWSDVFKSILSANGLEYRWTGRILQVLTIEEKKREFDLASLNNEIAHQETRAMHTGPLGVSVVNVRYSDATELQKTLAKFLVRNPDAVIEIDQHNNALIVQATDSEQHRIISLIEHLDRARRFTCAPTSSKRRRKRRANLACSGAGISVRARSAGTTAGGSARVRVRAAQKARQATSRQGSSARTWGSTTARS